jgi:hypothetical protein
MPLISRSRIINRFPSLWVDPDTSKNRIFIDTYGYDYTTLAPRSTEQFMWQNRANLYNTSETIAYDNYTPMQTGYMDGNCWAASNNDQYSLPGIVELWSVSLDYVNYKPTRNWKSLQNRIICTYPRTSDVNHQYGDWWCGFDMSKRGMSFRTQDVSYYVHLFEQSQSVNFDATSWSYSGTTITVNKVAHGLYYGDTITVTGTSMTGGVYPPNGTFVITQATNADSFQFVVGQAPTGTAAGTMNVQGTTYRAWGMEHESRRAAYANCGMSFNMIQGYDYTTQDNNTTAYAYFKNTAAASRPFYIQGPLGGGWKYFIGKDSTDQFAWIVHVDTANAVTSAAGSGSAYYIRKYALQNAAATETTVLAATKPAGALADRIIMTPSNLRIESLTRRVFYSSHYNATVLAPMRFVINMEGGTAVATDCILTYPSGTTFTTYSALPTANNYDAFGYNSYWAKPHQFTVGGVNYITFCSSDKFYYSNTARFPTRLARTWLTFTIGTETSDQYLTFHSAITFESASDFPLSWMPYTQTGEKIVITSTANTAVWTFTPFSWSASNWSYVSNGTYAKVTVTKENHGLTVGNEITTSGATATTNAPVGTYTIVSVPDANTFTFNVDSSNTGVITGAAGGTMVVSGGWQPTWGSGIRSRGFAVDSTGRLWAGVRTSGLGTVEVHVLKENTPYRVTINFQNSVASSTNTFEYLGSPTNTNILVSAYDIAGNRIATKLTLTIKSNNLTFAGGYSKLNITTSSAGETTTPVTITGPGQALISSTTVA